MPKRRSRSRGASNGSDKSAKIPQHERDIEDTSAEPKGPTASIAQDKPLSTINKPESNLDPVALLQELASSEDNQLLSIAVALLKERTLIIRSLESDNTALKVELSSLQTRNATLTERVSNLAGSRHLRNLIFGFGGVAAGVGFTGVWTNPLSPYGMLAGLGILLMWLGARKPPEASGIQ